MEKILKCSECDVEGLPSEFLKVTRDGSVITIRCAGCSKVVMELHIKEGCLVIDENKD